MLSRLIPPSSTLLWLLPLLGVSLLLRLPGLTESIWYDEYYRTRLMLRPGSIGGVLLHDVHNPLYNAFMYAWITLFGDAEVTIRIPSLLAGYGSALLFWRWVRRRWGAGLADLVLAWLLLSPVHAWYSTEAKNNMFTATFAVLILLTHDRLMNGGEMSGGAAYHPRGGGLPARLAPAIAAATLGVYTDFAALMALIPIWGAMAWLITRRESNLRQEGGSGEVRLGLNRLALIVGATAVLVSPLVLFKVVRLEELARTYLRHFNIREFVMLLCNWFPTGNALVPVPARSWGWGALAGLLIVPLLWLGIGRLRRTVSGKLVNVAFVVPLLFYAAASSFVGWWYTEEPWFYQERNLLLLLPLFALTLLAGAGSIRARPVRIGALALVMAMNGAGAVLAITVYADRETVMEPNPDWRGAAAILEAEADGRSAGGTGREVEGDPILIFSQTPARPMRYYTERPVHQLERGTPVELIPDALAGSGAPYFYLLNSRTWRPIGADELAKLWAEFPLVQEWRLRDLEVYKLRSPRVTDAPHPAPAPGPPPP